MEPFLRAHEVHGHQGFLVALDVVLALPTLVNWTNWLLLEPVHRLDPEPQLGSLHF